MLNIYFYRQISYNIYGDSMKDKKIDLSGIKEDDLDKTSSFYDLMSKKEKRKAKKKPEENLDNKQVNNNNNKDNDIEEMINEKRKNTSDLSSDIKIAKEKIKKDEPKKDENLGKTQILELTRQMKFNFEKKKEEVKSEKKKGISKLNIIGEVNLICIGYYIYLLIFTNYQDVELNYMITGGIIVMLVLLFGLSVVTRKKLSKFFMISNIIAIIGFIAFNIYSLMY